MDDQMVYMVTRKKINGNQMVSTSYKSTAVELLM